MKLRPEVINGLAEYELCATARVKTPKLTPEELKMYDDLLKRTPFTLKLVADEGVCEDNLFQICKRTQGPYRNFRELKDVLIREMLRSMPARPLQLSVLPNGIFVGEPTDLYNFRRKLPVVNPIKGLGEKISELDYQSKLL